MVSKSALIPIASLSAIVGVSLLFVIWWFPRTWNKGNAEERAIIDGQIQQRRAWLAMQEQQRAVNREGDAEAGEGEAKDAPPRAGEEPTPPPYAYMPPRPRAYVPPVAGLG